MKSSRPSTRQILRLLRFAGVMLLLGSVASASAQTVGERMKKDPSFRIYPVIFGVTATGNASKAQDERWEAGRGLHVFLLRSGASQCRGH